MGKMMTYALDLLLLNILRWGGQAQDVVLTAEPNWSTFYLGESITFRCYVNGGEETNWKYQVTRKSQDTFPYDSQKSYTLEDLKITEFQCSARWRGVCKKSETISLTVLAEKPRAALTAGSTTIPVGGSVTLRCLIESSPGWKYRWFRQISGTSEEISTGNEENRDITVKQGGIYWCEGQRGNPPFFSQPSHDVTIEKTLSNKVVVGCQPNEPYIGETITLTCEVQGGEITEWTCEWRRDGSFIHRTYNKDWTFRVSESSSGDYMCQCRNRDDWFSLTRLSEAFTVAVFNKVIVSRHPNWSQMFSGETITLTCEVQGGETTEWKCEWSRDGSVIHWTSKDWTFKALPSSSGDYICHCRRRDDWYSPTMWWSKAIKLSVARKPKVQLSANSLPGRVTLTCSVTPSPIGWKYYWYRDEKSAEPLTTQKPVFSPNELMSVSEKSLYWCRGGRGEPEYYTDYSNPITISNNVTVSHPVSFSLHLLLIVGPVSGVVLIILLLLWWRYKWSMDLCRIRLFRSESSSQRPTTNHESDYSSLLHGTTSLYETIHNRGATGNAERPPDPAEGSVYVNVRPDNFSSA
ncbi:PREDICTED: B-cell receptor CD22-like isoform X1 [Poecilia mexicana]|uniref:B-cell receptor CD22-like isoform X1 n=1 Tax=Poecilia mexicana TaxID=48701 RepID=UPI00072DA031|nr:PREDICTED: B-cell receptor CD22-like isoform X1 [Poecilia mexicana]